LHTITHHAQKEGQQQQQQQQKQPQDKHQQQEAAPAAATEVGKPLGTPKRNPLDLVKVRVCFVQLCAVMSAVGKMFCVRLVTSG